MLLSRAKAQPAICIPLPSFRDAVLRVLEVRLVYDRRKHSYVWHLVVENGKQPNVPAGTNVVSVDLAEIHPAVVGDEQLATIITCRERRHQQQAATIVIGDVRDSAAGVDHGKRHNQQASQWNHGQIRTYVTYKAAAEGMSVVLIDEHYTSQTCPQCGKKHKPRGRNYTCGRCGFSSHRDVVGQINILSRFRYGEAGKIKAPANIKHRIPHNLRVMRRRRDTGQPDQGAVAR